ncbi:MAG TPA: hypothetical protein VIF62_33400, partial [Labilithrix sp.]
MGRMTTLLLLATSATTGIAFYACGGTDPDAPNRTDAGNTSPPDSSNEPTPPSAGDGASALVTPTVVTSFDFVRGQLPEGLTVAPNVAAPDASGPLVSWAPLGAIEDIASDGGDFEYSRTINPSPL